MGHGALEGRRALAWLEQQVTAGHGGKVLLAGFDAKGAASAWAAGLRGDQDHPNFVTFARFALQTLSGCNAYWLFLPAEFRDCLGYRVELNTVGRTWQGEARWLEGSHWVLQENEPASLLGDLLAPGATLPGIMRRDLTGLAEQLQVEPPGQSSGAGE